MNLLNQKEVQLTGKLSEDLKDEDQDEIDRAIDIDFVVDAGRNKKKAELPEIVTVQLHKPKRYFSAKSPKLTEGQNIAKVVSSTSDTKKLQLPNKNSNANLENDWILTEKEEKKKPPREVLKETSSNSKKLLFEVYRGGEVYRTQYSTHEKAHDSYSWNMMYEMISGKYKDNDFETNMNNIVGHRRTKTEKDKAKL